MSWVNLTLYINSCIPWDKDPQKFAKLVEMSYKCGYQAAFVQLKSGADFDIFMKSNFFHGTKPKPVFPLTPAAIALYKTLASPVILFPCITLTPNNPEQLKQDLQNFVQKRCLIAVESKEKEILEVAARDGRVDILSVPTIDQQKAITKGILSLAKQNRCVLDISITPLLEAEYYNRPKIMRVIYRLFLNAKVLSHSYIAGLHSVNFWYTRGPKETVALLTAMFKVPEVHANRMLQENGETLALRFIKRDLGLFIEPDVEIVNIKPRTDPKNKITDDKGELS